MSKVYFHSADGTEAKLRGSERAHAACLMNDLFTSVLGVGDYVHEEDRKRWATVLPKDAYCLKDDMRHLSTYLRTTDTKTLPMNGERIQLFGMALQTMIDAGNDPMKLLARIHGQCEIHGWVEGKNRAWLAEIIKEGRQGKVFRTDEGWEEVAAHLLKADDSPIVMSYSVCRGFPNHEMDDSFNGGDDSSDEDMDDAIETWESLPYEERWNRCMKTLREDRPLCEMTPDNWAHYKFLSGVNAFEYREYLNSL